MTSWATLLAISETHKVIRKIPYQPSSKLVERSPISPISGEQQYSLPTGTLDIPVMAVNIVSKAMSGAEHSPACLFSGQTC